MKGFRYHSRIFGLYKSLPNRWRVFTAPLLGSHFIPPSELTEHILYTSRMAHCSAWYTDYNKGWTKHNWWNCIDPQSNSSDTGLSSMERE